MIANTAKLIALTVTYDSIRQPIYTESATEVFVEERAITRQEWFEAGRNGLNPVVELVTPFMNYNNERIVEYNGQRYSIYRTYRHGDNIELYLELKGGTYVGSSTDAGSGTDAGAGTDVGGDTDDGQSG